MEIRAWWKQEQVGHVCVEGKCVPIHISMNQQCLLEQKYHLLVRWKFSPSQLSIFISLNKVLNGLLDAHLIPINTNISRNQRSYHQVHQSNSIQSIHNSQTLFQCFTNLFRNQISVIANTSLHFNLC